MRIILILLLTLIIFISPTLSQELKKGDQLQILYDQVWAYTNPDDISTHLGPYSYYKKVTYLGLNEAYPGYIFVLTPDDKEAYIKENLVADNTILTEQQILDDIKTGKRSKSQFGDYEIPLINSLETWQILLLGLVILFGLYKLWKKFKNLDAWFLRKSNMSTRQVQGPWFLSLSAIFGGIIGACLTLIVPNETEWFFNEGLLIIPVYKSFWHWLLWSTFMLSVLTLVAATIHPFLRLKINSAVLYSLISFFLVTIYFIAGVFTGGIVVILILLALFTQGGGSGKGGNNNTVNTPKMPPTDLSKGPRWNELHKRSPY